MAIKSQSFLEEANPPKSEADKNQDALAPADMEEFDSNNNDDELALPLENELVNKRVVVRRKIEMYWEKKRLQEQLGDLGEFDFDF